MKYMFILNAGDKPNFEKVQYEDMEVSQRLDFYKDKIKCEWVEVVQLPLLPFRGACLIVDEEGTFKKNPQLNYIASIFYGTSRHGHPIVGNALLATQERGVDGVDITGFDVETATKIERLLNEMINATESEV